MSFVISTDTSANLPTAELQWHQLYLLPFSYIVNEVEHQCLDLSAFDGDAYYEMLRHTPASTSMISMDQYRQLWEPLLEEGHDILHVGMSSGISGAYQSAVMAARELREEYPQRRLVVFDTRAASLGEGIQVLHAATCREAGYTLDETVRELAELRPRIRQIFTVDDLMYLKRGGRVSAATALVGTMLSIKPVLHVDDEGHLINVGKARGRKSSIQALADKMGQLQIPGENDTVFICHGDCIEDAKYLESLVKERYGVKNVLIYYTGAVIASHSGPGTLALFFMGEHR